MKKTLFAALLLGFLMPVFAFAGGFGDFHPSHHWHYDNDHNPQCDSSCHQHDDDCVPDEPTDVCPNIDGAQATVPDGDQIVDGQCVPIPPPPVDLCPNLDGVQTVLPDGDEVNSDGQCVPIVVPPTDLCPNIEDVQATIPDGDEINSDGQCVPIVVTPPTDVCPNIDGDQAAVPDGMEIQDGQCVTPTPPDNGGGGGDGGGGGSTPPADTTPPRSGGGGGGGNGPIVGTFGVTNGGGGNGPIVQQPPPSSGAGEGLPPGCGIYLNDFLRLGRPNKMDQVTRLQIFLDWYVGANLPLSGVFDQATFDAVSKFQVKEYQDILTPWYSKGLLKSDHESTGYVYKTTRRKINLIMCNQLNIPMPQLP